MTGLPYYAKFPTSALASPPKLNVKPSTVNQPPQWSHDRPSGKTMTIRGRTIPAAPETLARGNDAASLEAHLAHFHSDG